MSQFTPSMIGKIVTLTTVDKSNTRSHTGKVLSYTTLERTEMNESYSWLLFEGEPEPRSAKGGFESVTIQIHEPKESN